MVGCVAYSMQRSKFTSVGNYDKNTYLMNIHHITANRMPAVEFKMLNAWYGLLTTGHATTGVSTCHPPPPHDHSSSPMITNFGTRHVHSSGGINLLNSDFLLEYLMYSGIQNFSHLFSWEVIYGLHSDSQNYHPGALNSPDLTGAKFNFWKLYHLGPRHFHSFPFLIQRYF